MPLPEELMEILVCPDCHGDLEERSPLRDGEDSVLVCLRCGLHYPVREGIPVMMVEEAYREERDA